MGKIKTKEDLLKEKICLLLSDQPTDKIDIQIKKAEKKELEDEKKRKKHQEENTKRAQEQAQKELNQQSVVWRDLVNDIRTNNFSETLTKYRKIFKGIESLHQSQRYHEPFLKKITPKDALLKKSSHDSWDIYFSFYSFESVEKFIQGIIITHWNTSGYNSGHGYVPGESFPGKKESILRLIDSMSQYMNEITKPGE